MTLQSESRDMGRIQDLLAVIRKQPDHKVIMALDELLPHWIPVEERLPEEGSRVLFYNAQDHYEYTRMVRVGRCIDDGPTGIKELRIVDFAAPTAVATHWMPLPEPPAS